jgi:hypothetical protein
VVLHNTARAARICLPTRTQEAVNAVIYAGKGERGSHAEGHA